MAFTIAPSVLWLGIWSPAPLGVDAVTAVTPGHVSVVGAASMTGPGAPASPTVSDLVRGAMYLSGGLHKAVDPSSSWILVRPDHGPMDDTALKRHVAVIRAVVLRLHDMAAEADISLLVGGVAATDTKPAAGLREALGALVDDPDLGGARVTIIDLEAEETEEVEVPDGGLAADLYPVPIVLLECDAVVNIARHVGPLSAMDNLEGLAGVAGDGADGDARRVDLALLAEVDYTLLDMLGHDGPEGPLLLASGDAIAVDRAAAAIAQTDTAAIAVLRLAHERRLGQADLRDIKVSGLEVPGTWMPAPDTTGAIDAARSAPSSTPR